jgi:hypothetical protein
VCAARGSAASNAASSRKNRDCACCHTLMNFILDALSPARSFMWSYTSRKELLRLSIIVTLAPCSSKTRTVWLANCKELN